MMCRVMDAHQIREKLLLHTRPLRFGVGPVIRRDTKLRANGGVEPTAGVTGHGDSTH